MFGLPTVSGVELEMNEMAEGSGRCADRRPPPASSSPRSSPGCSSARIRPPAESPLRYQWMIDRQDSRHRREELLSTPPSRVYEELFCTGRAADIVLPLTGAALTSSGPHGDVVKRGYLGKMDRDRRRYFALRAGSHTGPSRLEWYKNQEKFGAVEKSAGKATLFGSNKQGSRKGHTVALYAKDQTLVLVAEDQWEQEDWYLAIKKLMEEERKDEEHGEVFDEEDDGYCTLPSAAFFKEVWPVTVKPIGLGCSKSLAGESRLCLTATALILVRVAACSNLPSVKIPLLSVRRFGHLDGSFYLELGRSAPNGPGEIWMEARDQGNGDLRDVLVPLLSASPLGRDFFRLPCTGSPAVAQHVHEVVRESVRALRALPDFSGSPTSSHNQRQTLLALKRCRPKYRDKLARPPGSRLALPFGTSPTKCYLEPESPRSSASHRSSVSETGSYMEMKVDPHLPVSKGRENECRRAAVATGHRCSAAACGMESWEPGEDQAPGYMMMMMMSPPGSRSSPVPPQDDYVTMASPEKHYTYSSPSSSLQTSFNSSASDGYSPLHPSHLQTNEPSQPLWLVTSVQQSETDAGQSQTSIGCSAGPEPTSAEQRPGARAGASPSPVRSMGRTGMIGPDYARPVQAGPNSANGRSRRAASDKPVRRHRLSLCLPSCLQAEDRD
ncbi:Insulin receptor substrate 2-B [Liparis tanakae]|uniref:Insulin receptor substrate 2-B n=1 Tax=Liparis tanakae TaxID=230148 RepID=A0A4Z2GKU1_9TELE|nr:Insulin receptor substrate 2-B [Liparis tanakae]